MNSDGDTPTVYNIPADHAFADALARGVLAQAGHDPLTLARYLILLPTRRACRAVREAFLRESGGRAMILPRLQPIGDIDEEALSLDPADDPLIAEAADLPPAIPELRRRLLLMRSILAPGLDITADQAAWLAAALSHLLDQVQTERLDFAALADIVPEGLANHWQETLSYLDVLTKVWPEVLAVEGALDPADRRDRMLTARAAAWRAAPPQTPVIGAGSTGSIPATAELLRTIARLPAGAVVLPGLDTALDDAAWTAVDGAPDHPQHGMARLLDRIGVSRDDVAPWTGCEKPAAALADVRTAFLSEGFRPASTTDMWRETALDPAAVGTSLAGLTYVECPGPREEAGVIALALRQSLEDPGRTAALVTADRDLARRVAAALSRWGIEVDDSAGTPLIATPPGSFLTLVADMVAEALAPVPLLAALKHPLAAAGLAPADLRAGVRRLERTLLRGPRPGPGVAGLQTRLAKARAGEPKGDRLADLDAADSLIGRLAAILAPFSEIMACPSATVADLLQAHVSAAERLAADAETDGRSRLWVGDAGEAMANFVAELAEAAADFPKIEPRSYPALIEALMAGRVVRPRYGTHPRLAILGPLEARLQRFDLTVLGGLNEGGWPPIPEADPWMSRPMRAAFGLSPLERRIGLAAHDFVQAAAAPRVLLTRATRVEGAPTVPSRWLLRLEALLKRLGLIETDDAPKAVPWRDRQWLDWLAALDRPAQLAPARRPEPCPPVAARPRRLSVTQVGTLLRDPYAFYARKILGLNGLDPLDAPLGPAERGTIVHDALDAFIKEFPTGPLPAGALERLLAHGNDAFHQVYDNDEVRAFWWPRIVRLAEWFVTAEGARRGGLETAFTECDGHLDIAAPAGDVTLTGRADRIDRLTDGSLAIIDYKTGGVPTAKAVAAGLEPQLPLEAAMAREGGFGASLTGPTSQLFYWRLTGARVPGEIRDALGSGKKVPSPDEVADAALAGLKALLAHFDNPATAYPALPRPAHAPAYNDYAHLARQKEWLTADDGDGE